MVQDPGCRPGGPGDQVLNGNVRRVEIWALKYFGDLAIDRVTETELAKYVDWRLSQPKRPAVVTLKNERTAIRQLLRFARRSGYISKVLIPLDVAHDSGMISPTVPI